MAEERLQKILARAGYGSRRACERIIEGGRVTVDGEVAHLGDRADPQKQEIRVDGVPLARSQPLFYIMVHKPRGVISTTHDPLGRRTVLDLVPLPIDRKGKAIRVYPVGRLDAESEGLILLTNDGALANRLTHPRYEHPRVYRVLVAGEPTAQNLERWRRGIMLDGKMTRFDAVTIEGRRHGETWLKITVHEGRKHLVRRMVAALGYPPRRLIRTAMGSLQLGSLPPGRSRPLTRDELRSLKRSASQGPQRPRRGKTRTGRRPSSPRSRQRRQRK